VLSSIIFYLALKQTKEELSRFHVLGRGYESSIPFAGMTFHSFEDVIFFLPSQIKPPLKFYPPIITIPPTSVGDVNSSSVFVENISKVPHTFEICVPEDCPFLQVCSPPPLLIKLNNDSGVLQVLTLNYPDHSCCAHNKSWG
jgi:hypothetical protein